MGGPATENSLLGGLHCTARLLALYRSAPRLISASISRVRQERRHRHRSAGDRGPYHPAEAEARTMCDILQKIGGGQAISARLNLLMDGHHACPQESTPLEGIFYAESL
jgi:hypothetical protein